VSDRQPTAVELEKARLSRALPGWRVWTVDTTVGGTSWHAMPAGAETAVCNGHSPAELLAACRTWDADAYIGKAQAELDATPDDLVRKREMLTAQIRAASALRDAR
jgi:hypothetical protein